MDTCMYTYMYVYMSLSIYKDIKMSYECVRAACSVMSDSFATPWTVVHQVPLSMGFFRQENWSGLPFPPPGDFPNPRIESLSLASPALAGGFFMHH